MPRLGCISRAEQARRSDFWLENAGGRKLNMSVVCNGMQYNCVFYYADRLHAEDAAVAAAV